MLLLTSLFWLKTGGQEHSETPVFNVLVARRAAGTQALSCIVEGRGRCKGVYWETPVPRLSAVHVRASVAWESSPTVTEEKERVQWGGCSEGRWFVSYLHHLCPHPECFITELWQLHYIIPCWFLCRSLSKILQWLIHTSTSQSLTIPVKEAMNESVCIYNFTFSELPEATMVLEVSAHICRTPTRVEDCLPAVPSVC